MKVGAHPPSLDPGHRSAARVPPGGAKFAQLLEGGASAARIVSDRALGFDETGLLGLHFGGADRSGPRMRSSGRTEPAPDADGSAAVGEEPSIQFGPPFGPEPEGASRQSAQEGDATGPAIWRDDSGPSGDVVNADPANIQVASIEPDGVDTSAAHGPTIALAAALRARLMARVRLLRQGPGWVVQIDAALPDRDDQRIAAAVHDLATEYGVTVMEVIVRKLLIAGTSKSSASQFTGRY
ncbi:MAG: hypothetical protein JSS36_01270 [Proteobacteria bacterium]|nr:hypothetical protein [Pseudomonadota bacterium]